MHLVTVFQTILLSAFAILSSGLRLKQYDGAGTFQITALRQLADQSMGEVETMHQQNLDLYRDYNTCIAHCTNPTRWTEWAPACNYEIWQTASNDFNMDSANFISTSTGSESVMADPVGSLMEQDGAIPRIS